MKSYERALSRVLTILHNAKFHGSKICTPHTYEVLTQCILDVQEVWGELDRQVIKKTRKRKRKGGIK